MPALRLHRVTALPGTLAADSIYYVANPSTPAYVEVYVTGNTGAAVRRELRVADVQAMIDAAALAGGSGAAMIVDTIALRDAIASGSRTNGMQVAVIDATADATVATGGATYIWRASNGTWIKQTEWAVQDLVVAWGTISGRPSSSPAAIDAAVGQAHVHANMTQLGKIGEDGDGNLLYDGEPPRARVETSAW